MKKILILLVMVAMPAVLSAQSAFDKFEGKEDITTVVVNKKMFDILKSLDIDIKEKDEKNFKEVMKYIEKLDKVRLYTTKNSVYTAEMKSTVATYLKGNKLEELMRVNQDGKDIKVYVKTGSSDADIREMLVFVEGGGKEDTVLVSLTAGI